MYLADLEGCAPRFRPTPGPDLRAGRDADDHHGAVEGRSRRPRPSAMARPHAERRTAPHRRRGPRRRRQRERHYPIGEHRRGRGARRRRDARLLERARRHRRGAARRMAVHRRRRQLRRRGVSDPARPLEGPDHQRRHEHLPARGRRGAAPPRRCARRRRRRATRPGVGRGSGGVRRRRRRPAAPTVDDLDRACIETIARFKRPKEYRFVDSLPTNNYGKVVKRELRELLRAGDATPLELRWRRR